MTQGKDHGLEALLEAAQATEQPPAERMESSWMAIDQRLQADAGPSVPVDVRGLPGFPKSAIPLLAKLALLGTFAGVVAVAIVQRADSDPAMTLHGGAISRLEMPKPPRRELPPPPQAPPALAAPVLAPAVAVERQPLGPPRAQVRKPAVAAGPTAAPSRLAEETALLRRAWSALDRGRSVQAATVVAIHERDFAKGALVEEREAVRAIIGCRRDGSSPQSVAAAFARRFPKSVHRARVRRACAEQEN